MCQAKFTWPGWRSQWFLSSVQLCRLLQFHTWCQNRIFLISTSPQSSASNVVQDFLDQGFCGCNYWVGSYCAYSSISRPSVRFVAIWYEFLQNSDARQAVQPSNERGGRSDYFLAETRVPTTTFSSFVSIFYEYDTYFAGSDSSLKFLDHRWRLSGWC